MVTANAITWVNVILFVDHLARIPQVRRMDSRRMLGGLGNLAGRTQEIVTRCSGYIVSAREEGTITEVQW